MKTLTKRSALARASIAAFFSLLIVSSPALASTRTRTESAPAARDGQTLRFFTIAERVAALKASGALSKTQVAAPLAEPLFQEASLRGTVAVEPVVAPPRPQPLERPILGSVALPMPAGDLASKWAEMAQRWSEEQAKLAACEAGDCANRGAELWLGLRRQAQSLEGTEQLAFIHAGVNRSIRYATDLATSGAADYWASPLESIGKAGDCEDYVIAKYFLARSVGYAADDLRLVALFEPFSGMHHAILAVRRGGDWVFMDNKQAGLTITHDYRGSRPVATVGETGQALLMPVPSLKVVGLRDVQPNSAD